MTWDIAFTPEEPEPVERKPLVRARTITGGDRVAKYLESAINGEVERVTAALDGTRNQTLNRAAFSLAQLEEIPDTRIEYELTQAGMAAGLDKSEIGPTISSGIKAGREHPRAVPESTRTDNTMPDTGAPPADDYEYTDADAPDAAPISGEQQAAPEPPATGPLARFPRLSKVALVGYDALIAATETPIVWVWDGICTAAHATEITGPSGGGKTTLGSLLVAGFANSTGTPVSLLGRSVHPIDVGRYVLLIEQENGAHSMRHKLEVACDALQLPRRETIDRTISIIRKNVRSGDAVWGEIVLAARAGFIGAVFIDSRARVLRSGDSNSEEDQAAVADEITTLIEAAQAPVFTISHTKKGGDLEAIEALSGSAQRGAGTDNCLTVEGHRDDNGKVYASTARFIKLRDGDAYDLEDHPAAVTFSLVKDNAGSFYITESDVQPSSKEPKQSPEARVEAALATGPKTKGDLSKATKMNNANVDKALTNLFASHRVRSTEVTKNSRPEKAYELVRPACWSDKRSDKGFCDV